MGQFFKFLFASCLGVFLAIILLIVAGAAIGGSMAASADKKVSIEPNSVLNIKFEEPIPEKTDNLEKDPFTLDESKILGMHDIVRTLEKAKTDDDIKGIYLETEMTMMGFATSSVLRDALIDFKESGKFVISYGRFFTQGGYYMASVADKSFLHPLGGIDFRGFAASIPFMKNMLDNIGVKMQVYWAGEFKSATERFRLTEMSPESKLQTREFLSDIHDQFMGDIGESRNLSIAQLDKIANSYEAMKPKSAVASGLVDQIGHEHDALTELRDRLGLEKDDKIKMLSIKDYNKARPIKKDYGAKHKIAVLYAEGDIVDGKGENGSVGDEKYVKTIRKIRKDDKIKAIVLRVNSPGGSAMSSENIWKELTLAKEEGKKIVVSMGDYAASGGYYIACMADKIYAEPNTLTGSIGVFLMIPDASELLNDKIGITYDTVKTNTYADGIGISRPMAAGESAMIQERTDMMYETFLQRVADGRGMTRDAVNEVARGRVWTGQDAIGKGLVDELGGLEIAIAHAAELAEVTDYRLAEYPYIKDKWQQILEELTGKSDESHLRTRMLKTELGEYYPYYEQIQQIKEMKTPQARMPFILGLQ